MIALRRYAPGEIEAILTANGLSANGSLAFYAHFAGGLAGVAMDLAASGWFADLRRDTLQFFKGLEQQSRAALLTSGYQFFDNNRQHVTVMLDIMGSLVRDRLVCLCGASHDLLTNQDQMAILQTSRTDERPEAEIRRSLLRAYAALLSARRALSLNASFEALICNLLLCLRKEFIYA
jgi:hypothetical protein